MKLEVRNEIELRQLVKEAVRDALEEEILKLRFLVAPYVSDEEQGEIERLYDEPSKEVARTLILKE
ncbi:hypothetical protein M1N79_02510 [Dehalococcoidia bacterium]|nr:hypothetical protein [Dehalococcoidia bacterium]